MLPFRDLSYNRLKHSTLRCVSLTSGKSFLYDLITCKKIVISVIYFEKSKGYLIKRNHGMRMRCKNTHQFLPHYVELYCAKCIEIVSKMG